MTTKLFRKKRGKFDEIREERKKRRGDIARENALAKRRKIDTEDAPAYNENQGEMIEDEQGDYVAFEDTTGDPKEQDEAVFYGLLDPEEQTYYANVNSKIVANDFESEDDRDNFIGAVYRESEGKELKLASSQSCSRHLEKIILLSSEQQLKTFFRQLLGSLTHLVQHRFGSHVCETLFLQSARFVTKGKDAEPDEESLESLLLEATKELKPNVGFMLTDRFASHTIRVLVLILSGEPLDDESVKTLVASRKKETLDGASKIPAEGTSVRSVPKSFKKALTDLITNTVSRLDSTYLRALATHPTGNPVLQLLLKLELHNSDKGRQLTEKSLYGKLIPPGSIEEGGEAAKFIAGLGYDSTGSHLVEVLVVDSPGRIFAKLYKNVWKDKMESMAKNEIACYVAIRILERLGKDELVEARDMLLRDIPTLLRRRRMQVLQCLVDRSITRGLDMNAMARSISKACNGLAEDVVPTLLYPSIESDAASKQGKGSTSTETSRADTRGSLLVQSLTQAPETALLVEESLVAMDDERILRLCIDAAASRVVQSALTSTTASTGFRKRFIPRLYSHITILSKHAVGSYTIDVLWNATNGLHFIKEKIASELAAHETELRESLSGRNVWRNWSMDVYARRPAEWRAIAKGQNGDMTTEAKPKTAFQLAQQRHGQKRQPKAQLASGANAIAANA